MAKWGLDVRFKIKVNDAQLNIMAMRMEARFYKNSGTTIYNNKYK